MLSKFFTKQVNQQLFPQNDYYLKSRNVMTLGGIVGTPQTMGVPIEISIPQIGYVGNVKENATQFPLEVSQVADSHLKFTIDMFYTPLKIVTGTEQKLLMYTKENLIMEQQRETIQTYIADKMMFSWIPDEKNTDAGATSRRLLTSGTSTRTSSAKGSTATVKKAILADWVGVYEAFLAQNIDPAVEQVFVLMPNKMYSDLLEIAQLTDSDKVGKPTQAFNADWKSNGINTIFGMQIMRRNNMLQFDANDAYQKHKIIRGEDGEQVLSTPILAADATSGAVAWQESKVCHYLPAIESLVGNPREEYLGGRGMVSFGYLGGSFVRTDRKGVITLIESK